MTPTPGPDPRLDELFVRYWDNSLTPAEIEELGRRLAADPVAQETFALLSLQAVTAADLPAIVPPAPAPPRPRGWSRRRVLGYLGGGLAAAVTAGIVGRQVLQTPADSPVRLTAASGTITVRTADGTNLPPEGFICSGVTVTTHGVDASVKLTYPDGTTVTLTGDTVVNLIDRGYQLLLRQGAVVADIQRRPDTAHALTLTTAQVSLIGLSGVAMTLGQALQATQVGVLRGVVNASAPSGERLAVVREGEVLTVRADGDHRKQPIPPVPEEYAWDLTRPLPEGWPVGRREVTPQGPVLVPESWPDPYYNHTPMYQIRSDNQWMFAFFRLQPESVIRVRYRVEREGWGQMCFCTRTPDPHSPRTGMLDWSGNYIPPAPGGWRWLEVRATEMLNNKHAPKFGPPWVGFLVIFNTYTADLGLKVAEFRVARPGEPVAVP